MSDKPSYVFDAVWHDLASVQSEFDAVVCAMDAHALMLGTLVAANFGKPLMAVCQSTDHGCVTQHTVCYGPIEPTMRFLYVDDFFTMGRTLAAVFEYMNQACQYIPGYPAANIVATYEASTHKYRPQLTTMPTSYVPPF